MSKRFGKPMCRDNSRITLAIVFGNSSVVLGKVTVPLVIDKWKKAVDSNKVFLAVLADLSKAFDCICHDLLIAKLNTDGLSLSALKLITDYLQNGK